MSDIAKQLEEAKAKRAGAEKTRVETHNAAFVAAYLKKLEGADDSDAFVEVDIPRVGKCLSSFPTRPNTRFQASSERAE